MFQFWWIQFHLEFLFWVPIQTDIYKRQPAFARRQPGFQSRAFLATPQRPSFYLCREFQGPKLALLRPSSQTLMPFPLRDRSSYRSEGRRGRYVLTSWFARRGNGLARSGNGPHCPPNVKMVPGTLLPAPIFLSSAASAVDPDHLPRRRPSVAHYSANHSALG